MVPLSVPVTDTVTVVVGDAEELILRDGEIDSVEHPDGEPDREAVAVTVEHTVALRLPLTLSDIVWEEVMEGQDVPDTDAL